jgi:hypothetical protein
MEKGILGGSGQAGTEAIKKPGGREPWGMRRIHGPEVEDKRSQRLWIDKLLRSDQTKTNHEKKDEKETEKNEDASDSTCWQKKSHPHHGEDAETRCHQTEGEEIEADHRIVKDSCFVNNAIGKKEGKAENQDHP